MFKELNHTPFVVELDQRGLFDLYLTAFGFQSAYDTIARLISYTAVTCNPFMWHRDQTLEALSL